jgi:type II secretory ATPase GspE/PulE/Tfp pilus assembly ATPase PilB-like protein
MTAPIQRRNHWIVDTLRRAKTPNAEALDVPAAASLEEAWTQASAQIGITPTQMADVIGKAFGCRVADLESVELRALRLVPEATARKHQVLPLRESDRQLIVATSNPLDLAAEQAVAFSAGRNVTFEVAPPNALTAALNIQYSPNLIVEAILGKLDSGDDTDGVRLIDETETEHVSSADIDSRPMVRLTALMLQHAINERASDVHIEPGQAGGHVRIRVDGVMQPALQLPMALLVRVVSRIKIIAKLDIADRHRPQDGRARIEVHGKTYDLRVSTVPTRDAEKVVIRILDPGGAPVLDTLGIPKPELARIRNLLTYREGIIFVTGPTGSGKSTTLYSVVRELATGKINIMTVEDPVEYELAGITQIQVEPKRGVTFASALRAMLRQDPDVIYVGEIRDIETAEIAAQAAMTGHLVVASLHTNDAVGVVPRLRDLGLPAPTIAAAVRGVVGQRLVRKLCLHCAEDVKGALTASERTLSERHGVIPVKRAVGCNRCGNTGYRGRAAVAEVLVSNAKFSDAIVTGAPPGELDGLAKANGMRPMRRVAADLVLEGVTSVQELDRVVGGEANLSTPAASAAPKRRSSIPIEAVPDIDEGGGPRVLVVDDDPMIRALATALLDTSGMRVTSVENGRLALEKLERQEFDLAVIDLEMPEVSGMELLKQIRSRLVTAGLPVVVLTGSDSAEDEIRVMDAGADDYVTKPLVPERLLTRIKSVLRRAGASAS